MKIPFRKMHGCGNDFIVIDGRSEAVTLDAAQVRFLSDRRRGIGCDQLIIIGTSAKADASMKIYNCDGTEIATCGNATRCIADILMREKNTTHVTMETEAGIREGWRDGEVDVRVDMGAPRTHWSDIPLSESRNTLHLGLQEGPLMDPVALSMGNPHAVFFVPQIDVINMALHGAKLEHHSLFPARANISAVQVLASDHLRMKVWERGTGETLACGSAACAAVVAGYRRSVCDRTATVDLPGGSLRIEWQSEAEGGHVMMSGPVTYVFEGSISLEQ